MQENNIEVEFEEIDPNMEFEYLLNDFQAICGYSEQDAEIAASNALYYDNTFFNI